MNRREITNGNPYTQGNWAGLKARPNSLGDKRHVPGTKEGCVPPTNTPKPVGRVSAIENTPEGGMATPNVGTNTNGQ